MIDHERFRFLAARDVGGQLEPDEILELEAHLSSCPTCRSEATRLKRDHLQLSAVLADLPVSPRVRSTVVAAAQGRHSANAWPLLAAAALIVLLTGATGLLVGSQAPSPNPIVERSVPPPTEPTVSATSAATVSPSASTTLTPAASVAVVTINGAYAYSPSGVAQRRDSVAVRGGDPPSGTWSRLIPDTNRYLGGPITCLVVDGSDAWMAGPVAEASADVTGAAAFLYVHDSGVAGGAGDTAVTWIADPGQTLETMEGWCRGKYIPAGPYTLDDGDIVIAPDR